MFQLPAPIARDGGAHARGTHARLLGLHGSCAWLHGCRLHALRRPRLVTTDCPGTLDLILVQTSSPQPHTSRTGFEPAVLAQWLGIYSSCRVPGSLTSLAICSNGMQRTMDESMRHESTTRLVTHICVTAALLVWRGGTTCQCWISPRAGAGCGMRRVANRG